MTITKCAPVLIPTGELGTRSIKYSLNVGRSILFSVIDISPREYDKIHCFGNRKRKTRFKIFVPLQPDVAIWQHPYFYGPELLNTNT
jgi:hypothetical protein